MLKGPRSGTRKESIVNIIEFGSKSSFVDSASGRLDGQSTTDSTTGPNDIISCLAIADILSLPHRCSAMATVVDTFMS